MHILLFVAVIVTLVVAASSIRPISAHAQQVTTTPRENITAEVTRCFNADMNGLIALFNLQNAHNLANGQLLPGPNDTFTEQHPLSQQLNQTLAGCFIHHSEWTPQATKKLQAILRNMTSSSNVTTNSAARPLFQIPPQNQYSQQPNNNYPSQSMPPTYPYSPYQQQQQPVILSHSAYTDSSGDVHIVGEVMNESPTTVNFVQITVTFYNVYGQVVGTDHTYTEPTDLAPGQRAPFELIETSGSMPMDQVRNYVLSVSTS